MGTHRRPGIARSFADGYRQARGPRHSHDQRYHRNQHRKHAAKNVRNIVVGAIFVAFVLFCCVCGPIVGMFG